MQCASKLKNKSLMQIKTSNKPLLYYELSTGKPHQECKVPHKLQDDISPDRIKTEKRAFWLITIILAPLLSIILVGGMGFLIWIYQMIAGPPGPPSGLG